MAFITYPLNNIDYTAEDAELFHCTRTSGIWAEDSFPISVTGTDNNVTIGTGIAWINNEEFSGKVTALKSAEVLGLGIADSIYPRIDVIAIQFNVNNNKTDVIVKQGTPASNPIRPAIVRTGAIYELYLASIYRPAGATAVTASNITDLRMDGTVCGLMADSVTSVDTDAINSQITELISELRSKIAGVIDGSAYWLKEDVIPVSNGGTGATNANDAIRNLGAAPAGYGLGTNVLESITTLEEADNFKENGWRNVELTGESIEGSVLGTLRCDAGSHFAVQTFAAYLSLYGGFYELKRVWSDGWYPWEWVTPPLQLGVEYRTTERYAGSPVYVKLINFGNLPNNTYKGVDHGIENIRHCINVEVTANNDVTVLTHIEGITHIAITSTTVGISTSSDKSVYEALILLKYIK